MARAAQSLQALWLTGDPTVALEHFTGEQRLALLSHINQGIALQGLAQAMQAPLHPSLPTQIAIIANAEHLPAADVQMLQDLTRYLPGLPWRWVLLCQEQPGEQNSAAVASMKASEPPLNGGVSLYLLHLLHLLHLHRPPSWQRPTSGLRDPLVPNASNRPDTWSGWSWRACWAWALGERGFTFPSSTQVPLWRLSASLLHLQLHPQLHPQLRLKHRHSHRLPRLSPAIQQPLPYRRAKPKNLWRPMLRPTQPPCPKHLHLHLHLQTASLMYRTLPCGAYAGWPSNRPSSLSWNMALFRPLHRPRTCSERGTNWPMPACSCARPLTRRVGFW